MLLPVFPVNAESIYREVPVSESGTINGKVTFSGKVPAPKIFNLKNFPHARFCSKISNGLGVRTHQPVRVGEGGVLGNAVVYIENIQSGKPFNFNGTQVNSKDCEFVIHGGPSSLTGVVVNHSEFRLFNEDSDPSNPETILGVPHNPEGHEVLGKRKQIIFKSLLLEKGEIVRRKVNIKKKKSYVLLQCGMHDYMRAYFLPVENPYYSIVGDDGQFSIDKIPPGKYKVSVWHPTLGRIVKKKVKVLSNETIDLNFTFKK